MKNKKVKIVLIALGALMAVVAAIWAAVMLPYRPVEFSYDGVRWVDEEPDKCDVFHFTISGEFSRYRGFDGPVTLVLSVEGEEAVVMENYTIERELTTETKTAFWLWEPDGERFDGIVANISVRDSSWKEICLSFWEENASGNGQHNTYDVVYSAPAATREEAVVLTNEILGAMAEFEGVVWE